MSTSIKQTILERLENLGIKPSKGLGQNFLIDSGAYDRIVDAAELKPEEIVLEIGPGLGTLTERIAEKGVKVLAVEKDRKLIKFLENLFNFGLAKSKVNVKIIEGDSLRLNLNDFAELGLEEGKYKVVANIPYYITGQLLRKVFEEWPRPSLIVLLLQKEVAQRIMAKPPHSNILSLSVQYFAEPKIISYISKHNFYPSPKVDSAIIKLVSRVQGTGLPRSKPAPSDGGQRDSLGRGYSEETKRLFVTIKTGFSSRRKKLANNLSTGFSLSKEQTNVILREADIEENVRPENLTLDQWQKLANRLIS